MKTLLKIIIPVLLLSGCGIKQKINSRYDRMVLGTWVLTDVHLEGQEGQFKAVLFNEADMSCFQNSTWTFIRGNSMGSYTLNNGENCPQGLTRDIRWSIYKDDAAPGVTMLQFKRLDADRKPMDNNVGYRMVIEGVDANSMLLRGDLMVNNQPMYLVYTFEKQVTEE